MAKKIVALGLALFASSALAQSSAQIEANKGVLKVSPTTDLPSPCRQGQLWFDLTTTSAKVCNDGINWTAIGGGAITAGTTATSGCTDGAFLYSLTSLVRCGAVMITNGNTVTINNGAAAASILKLQDNGTTVIDFRDNGDTLWGSTPKWGFYTSGANNDMQLGLANMTWGSAYNVNDSGFTRLAAGVMGATLGSTSSSGWIRNSGGELALNADYTNATTTFSSTALSATLISGRTYNFTVNLLMADSTAADGMKLDFNGGAATITNFRVNCVATNDTTGATVAFTAATSTTLAGVLNIATMASTGTHMVICNGTIVPSSSNTFILRAAQNAHSTGTLTITRGSWISIKDARPL